MNKAILNIRDLTLRGQGIGQAEAGERVFFVDGALPGEVVEAELYKRRSNYNVARLTRIIHPSPERISPTCPVFPECGGCQLRHLSYPAQLRWKEQHLCNTFKSVAGIDLKADSANTIAGGEAVANGGSDTSGTPSINAEGICLRPIIGMNEPYGYRTKVQFPVGGSAENPCMGFYRRNSREIVPAIVCDVQQPVANRLREVVLDLIRVSGMEPWDEERQSGLIRHFMVRCGANTGDVMAIVVVQGNEIPPLDGWFEQLAAAVAEFSTTEEAANNAGATNATNTQPSPRLKLRCFGVNLHPGRNNVVLGRETRILGGDPYIEEIINGVRYRLSPGAFFQVNPRQATVLYDQVLRLLGDSEQVRNNGDLQVVNGGRTEAVIVDLYCGTGAITLQVAANFAGENGNAGFSGEGNNDDIAGESGKDDVAVENNNAGLFGKKQPYVIGVDNVAVSIADARANAERNGLADCTEFHVADAGVWLSTRVAEGLTVSAVIVDPPRSGLEPQLIDTLNTVASSSHAPERLIYVSCNPATLARDIALLMPHWQVREIQPVDMFPLTTHVESVVLLSRY
ncbi:MAG: class I SAM-dependent RNA methyltransferase [Clostridiaceae bacterium]|nr:class I SAM-dependent RNA methyltransferase [Clostridiaceae bacterium]